MQRIKIPLLAICLVLATTRAALAFTAPSAGDMWYTMYEVFYDRLVAGPLGGLLTGGVLAWGLAAAIRGVCPVYLHSGRPLQAGRCGDWFRDHLLKN